MQRNKISFKGQKIFVGIDVHKTTWEVAVLTESGLLRRHSQESSAKVLFDFLRKHYPDGEYHAVYESGFSGFATYYALKEFGIECTITHAADVPTTQYEEVMKTDRIDAEKLARALKNGEIKRPVYIREKDNIDDRAVISCETHATLQWCGNTRVLFKAEPVLVESLHYLADEGCQAALVNKTVTGSADTSGRGDTWDSAGGYPRTTQTQPD